MILLHRHSEAGALIGADSPELAVVAPEEVRLSPPTAPHPDPYLSPAVAFRDFISSWEEGGASEGAESEGVGSEEAAVAEALVCRSALTARESHRVGV